MSETVGALPDTKNIPEMLAFARRLVKIGRGLAAFTRSTVDDDLLAKVETALDVIEPIASEPWVVELIAMVIGLLKKGDADAVAKVKDIVSAS